MKFGEPFVALIYEGADAGDDDMSSPYWTPSGGLPPQTQLVADRAVFTTGYAVIPKGVLTDIVTSQLPFWNNTKLWVLARPLTLSLIHI